MENKIDIVVLEQPHLGAVCKAWMEGAAPLLPLKITKDGVIIVHPSDSIGQTCNTSDLEINKANCDDLLSNYHYCSGDSVKPKIITLEEVINDLAPDQNRKIVILIDDPINQETIMQKMVKQIEGKELQVHLLIDLGFENQKTLVRHMATNKELQAEIYPSLESYKKKKDQN